MDAAEACFERYGVAKTTIEDVAAAAHVSRATVYRYFERGRDEIVFAVLLREADRYETLLHRRLASVRSIVDMPVEAVLFTVELARRNPRLALLFAPEVAGQTGAFLAASEVLKRRVATLAAPYIDQGKREEIVRADLRSPDVAEWLIRIAVSLLTAPSSRTVAQERRFLKRFLAPAFLAMPADGPRAPVVGLARKTPRRR